MPTPRSEAPVHKLSRVGTLGVLIALVLLSCGGLVSRSILDGFSRLETQNILGEVGWVMADLEGKAYELGEYTNDIGTDPEALSFLEQPTPRFLADYFDPISAEVMMFDFAALFDANGEYVAGVRYDVGIEGESKIAREPSRLLEETIAAYELERGQAKIDLINLGSNVYLTAVHPIYDIEQAESLPLGGVMIGQRVELHYEEYEGALGTTLSLVSPRRDSAWKGEGQVLRQSEVYVTIDEEILDEGGVFDELADWEDEDLGDWEVIEFELDLAVFESTQYYRLENAQRGPDGNSKTVVMCSIGGDYSESEVVMKVLVPQVISDLASQKARLVNLALGLGVVLTIAFTWFAVVEIRRRRVAEVSLRVANQQLEEVNGQKDRLFSIIGHDLRAPLNGVIRLSELMARAPDSFEGKDISRFANNINLTGKQLHGLLENLLNWARLQTGQLSFNPIPIDLRTVVHQVVSLYGPRAEEKGIEIDVDVTEGTVVLADREMLKTVLRNLMSNAVKFTEKDGSVSFSVSQLEGFARISVSDTGCGMSHSQVSHLFELKAKPSSRSAPELEQGSGFGLLLCQEMVRRHDSELEVYSEPELGSEFSFSLPVVA